MKIKASSRLRKPALNLKTQSFTLSRAKTYLGRLVDKAMRGEPVYIIRGQDRFPLQHVPEIEPVPIHPPGYFADCYTREEIALDNLLSKASVIKSPKDLE